MTATPITSDQEKHIRRFIEDTASCALKEAALDKKAMQRFFARGGEFQAYLLVGVRRFSAKAPDYTLARDILGKDFISPEEIAKSRKLVYADEQLATFGETLPSREELEWLRDNGFLLVAGPPRPMSLLDIRVLHAPYFCSKEGGWYADEKERFSREEKVETTWLKLRKGPVPDSFRKSWGEQLPGLSAVEYVPNDAEVEWGVTSYKAVRGIYLLPDVGVRTSSMDSFGDRVVVGFFGGKGLLVDDDWDDFRGDDLGLASARK